MIFILTCRHFVEWVTEAREGALGFWSRLQYRFHLWRCRRCRTYIAQMESSIAMTRRAMEEDEDL